MLAAKITTVFLFNMWLENPNCQAWVHANYVSLSLSVMLFHDNVVKFQRMLTLFP